MEVKLLMKTARSATFEMSDGGIYYTKEKYQVRLNGKLVKQIDTVVFSLFDLKPGTDYQVEILKADGELLSSIDLETEEELYTLNVRAFGARGDGENDDTEFIQAAILACPEKSRVLIPAGVYKIRSLFLKSHLNLELARGAELRADTDRTHFPIFPGVIQSYDESSDYNLGTWEGNPLDCFAGILTGVNVEDVKIYGEGTLNGNASHDNWWKNCKVKNIAFRPRLVFLNHCKNVVLQGIKCCNSPSWTLHPYFSDNLGFYDLFVENPADSHNTDGLDPESCKDVVIEGVHFSVGDDCIAVKSGKVYMGKKFKTPSENLLVRQCLMEDGHGAVTIGSEMAGGVRNLKVEECAFRRTDRGLRIKTRRGRGEDAILDDISFYRIDMDHVMTPFVVNAFYFCDPDGRTEYVQSRDSYPVDERTPQIRRLAFEDIHATNCHVAAAFFDGLPEKKIEEIVMRNVSVSYAADPKSGVPAMSEGVDPCSRKGIYARNVSKLTLKDVQISGQEGEAIVTEGVEELDS